MIRDLLIGYIKHKERIKGSIIDVYDWCFLNMLLISSRRAIPEMYILLGIRPLNPIFERSLWSPEIGK